MEDAHLQAYIKLYGTKVMEEHAQNKEQQFLSTLSPNAQKKQNSRTFKLAKAGSEIPKFTAEETEELIHRSVDWRIYRIPAHHRRNVVNRYYMMQLTRHIRAREQFLDTIKLSVRWQQEMVRFLKVFGAESTTMEPLAMPNQGQSSEAHDFWQFPEDLAIEMISLSAQALKGQAVFSEHPANKDQVLPQEVFDKYCRPPRRLKDNIRLTLQNEINHNVPRATQMRLRRGSGMMDMSTREAAPGKTEVHFRKPQVDVDQLFTRFTPRLREIVQEQADEYRMNCENEEGIQETRSPGAPPLGRGNKARDANKAIDQQ